MGELSAPYLTAWANNMGLQGTKLTDYYASIQSAGKAVHKAVEGLFVNGGKIILSEGTSPEVLIPFARVQRWASGRKFEQFKQEVTVESSKLGYRGRLDLVGILDGKWTLVEVKSSKTLYDTMKVQAVAEAAIARDSGFPVEQVMVVVVPRQGEAADDSEVIVWEAVCDSQKPGYSEEVTAAWLLFDSLRVTYLARQKFGEFQPKYEK
jgi:hypothetical protein